MVLQNKLETAQIGAVFSAQNIYAYVGLEKSWLFRQKIGIITFFFKFSEKFRKTENLIEGLFGTLYNVWGSP